MIYAIYIAANPSHDNEKFLANCDHRLFTQSTFFILSIIVLFDVKPTRWSGCGLFSHPSTISPFSSSSSFFSLPPFFSFKPPKPSNFFSHLQSHLFPHRYSRKTLQRRKVKKCIEQLRVRVFCVLGSKERRGRKGGWQAFG